MTTINCNQINDRYVIEITGHAGYKPGNDIVCSAVSMLSYTLMECLEQNNSCLMHSNISADNGEVFVDVEPYTEYRDKIDAIIETVMTGYRMLAETYPENVEVNM